jgi:hypothetical protein
MTWNFTVRCNIELTGDIEADSREEAENILDRITTELTVDGNGVVFNIPSEVEYLDIEPDDTEVYGLFSADEDE